ncbi:hypothetical protein [Microbulbifer donghaiensis]|uniref:hypothetical protein n=1 Tax=Microbulbifer donghaiensis TaxID=494016 RepID=UPI00135655F8|nr:hypothetical protein [Microbulbifer donghaiensis]
MNFEGILKSDPIVVAFTVDYNYAMPMAVTIKSLLFSLGVGRDVFIFVVDVGVSVAK